MVLFTFTAHAAHPTAAPWQLVTKQGNGLLFIKAEFHYALLVADRSEAGRRPVVDLLARASELDDRPNSSSL